MKKLFLFDFDGTVIDNSEGIYNCIRYATDKMGMPRADAATLRSFIGPALYDSYLRHYENDPARAKEFVRLYRERFAPVGTREVRLCDGIVPVLRRLRDAGGITAVCSSKPLEFVVDIARYLEVDRYFSAFYCPSAKDADTDSDKTGQILRALREQNVAAADAVMIGDTKYDIEAARRAGVEAVGVRYGFAAPGELETAGAARIADTAEALCALLFEGADR